MRAWVLLLCVSLAAAYAQAPAGGPRFEVASIKPSLSPPELRAKGLTAPRYTANAARFQIYNNLEVLIRRAYRLEPYQKVTGPDWMSTTWFEVMATLPEGAAPEQTPEMLQALLADRFHLVVRSETAERAVYALVVGKDGPKLEDAPTGDLTSARPFPNGPGERILLSIAGFGPDGWHTYSRLNGSILFEASRITLSRLASVLTNQVDLPVIDRTGLKGAYKISLLVPHGPNGVSAVAGRAGAPGGDSGGSLDQASLPSGVNIFKSVEKLGLELEKSKARIDNLVVERLDRVPTEN